MAGAPQLALPLASSNGQTATSERPAGSSPNARTRPEADGGHERGVRLPAPAGDEHSSPASPASPTSPTSLASRSWLDSVITLVVAVVAAAASYGHMYDVALLAGEPLWIARAFPVTVDGLVLAALRRGEAGRRWLALGVVVSIACNVLGQFPEHVADVGPVVSAWPPLALYGTHRLLHGDRVEGRGSGRLEPSAPTRTNETPRGNGR
jgi:hypothetical protein